MAKKEEAKKIAQIRQKTIESFNDSLSDRYLYTVKFDEFILGNLSEDNEVPVTLKNVYISATQHVEEIEKGKFDIKRKFILYNEKLNQIGETDENGKLDYENEKFDKEITEEIIKLKQVLEKLNEEGNNLSVAGLNENGKLEMYIQIYRDNIITLTKRQKELMEKDKKANEHLDRKSLDNKKDEKSENLAEEQEKKNKEIALDLGIDPQDIYQITEIKEDLFYRNNNIPGLSGAYALKDRSGNLMIVHKNSEGKFEKSESFNKSTNESGRTSIATTDSNKIKEDNFYGAIYSSNRNDVRYVCEIGQYGEIKLIEQIKITQNESGQTIRSDEMWSPGREVATDNTDYLDVDRKGIGADNNIRATYNRQTGENVRMNREAAKIRNKNDDGSLTPVDISDVNTYAKAEFIMQKVEAKLDEKSLEMPEEYKDKLREYLESSKTATMNDTDIEKLCEICENDIIQMQEEKNEQSNEESLEQENENQENEPAERTLLSDAMAREKRKQIEMRIKESKSNNKYA